MVKFGKVSFILKNKTVRSTGKCLVVKPSMTGEQNLVTDQAMLILFSVTHRSTGDGFDLYRKQFLRLQKTSYFRLAFSFMFVFLTQT